MGAFIEAAAAVLAQSTHGVEVAAQNVANLTTSGYKRRIPFTQLLMAPGSGPAVASGLAQATDFAAGKLVETGDSMNLAILGAGFFVVRSGDERLYTRQGQFVRDADGRLADVQGRILQGEGGDLVVPTGDFKLTADGVVLADGAAVDRLSVVAFDDPATLVPAGGSAFSSAADPEPLARPVLRQGAIEASNVSTADEMMAVMAALRRAEAGQRLVNVYDDLMGRALTTFGQV